MNFFETTELMVQIEKNKKFKKNKKQKYYHFLEYRFTKNELHYYLKKSNFKVLETVPHDFHGSIDHAIGLGSDFPFLRKKNTINFQLNRIGKLISIILDRISPWITCASVLCVGKSLKKG